MGQEKHTAQPAAEDAISVLKALAEASAVFVALTFVGGWSYLATYYKTFGLNPLELDFSVPVVSTVALYVLYEAAWPLIVAALLVILAAAAFRYMHGLRRGIVSAAFLIMLLATSAAGVYRGRAAANRDMIADSPGLPLVSFASRVERPEPECVDHDTYGSMDCKLLLHIHSTYYFFEPVPKVGIGNINLYSLAESEVLGVHVQRGVDRNEGSQ